MSFKTMTEAKLQNVLKEELYPPEQWTEEEMQSKMNMIHNVDCLEFMRKVPDNYFDLVLTF